MGKHIVILNGSPRSHGNTEEMAVHFQEGAEEAGHRVSRFDLHKLHIKPCLGCYGCAEKKGNPCIQKDDMQAIYPVYRKADALVLASPLYYWSFTGLFKTAFDRLFAEAGANDFRNPPRECFLLIAAEDSGRENFKPIIAYYQSLLKRLGWTDRGMVLAGGVSLVGDIRNTPFLEEARKLGAAYR